uniref:IS66 family transposase n=1 Tax=Pandoraea sputorum TaxID=93222 RepID=UPI0037C50650
MTSPTELDSLNLDALRALAARLMAQVGEKDRELHYRQTRIDQLTHEVAMLKHMQFGKRSEKLDTEQMNLLEETMDADLGAIELELAQLKSTPASDDTRRPQTTHARNPNARHCRSGCHAQKFTTSRRVCGCERVRVGEDISEKLDYTPGVFTVERHIRGKWACKACETLIQAPVPAHVIDKEIPTTGLLAQVLVAKFGDHLPLYRQERIFARAGLAIPQSTLGAWIGACGVQLQPLVDALREALLAQAVLHADETPVQMLAPGKGKT